MFTAAALLAVAPVIAGAQSWETIVSLSDPNSTTTGYAVMVDPFSPNPSLPDLFIGGVSQYGRVMHVDQSTVPATVTPADTAASQTTRLAKDPAGNLYSAGYETRGGSQYWQVRKSSNGGFTWDIIDDAGTWNSAGNSLAYGLSTDSTGNVFASGSAITDGDYNRADHIAADPAGNVYVAGLTQQTGSGAKWTVRRWDAATQTWDQWPIGLRHPLVGHADVSTARGITADAFGSVYATGNAANQWIVQKLTLP